ILLSLNENFMTSPLGGAPSCGRSAACGAGERQKAVAIRSSASKRAPCCHMGNPPEKFTSAWNTAATPTILAAVFDAVHRVFADPHQEPAARAEKVGHRTGFVLPPFIVYHDVLDGPGAHHVPGGTGGRGAVVRNQGTKEV